MDEPLIYRLAISVGIGGPMLRSASVLLGGTLVAGGSVAAFTLT